MAATIYGRKFQLACHHSSRPVALVPFTTGSSQGDGTGAGFSAGFVAHFAGTQTLVHFPDIPVHIRSIMDDFYTVDPVKYLGPIFQVLSDILLDCAGI